LKNRLLQFIGAAAFLFFSAALVTHFLAKREVQQTVRDLAEAKGKIVSYSFLDGVKGSSQYTIHLSGYPAAFQVPPEDAQYFARARFQSNLKVGDTLSVWISPDSAARLTSAGPVPIFAARSESSTYLDEYYTLGANHNGNLNDNKFPLSLVPLFIRAGVACVVLWIVTALITWMRTLKFSPAPPRNRESVSVLDGAFISQSSRRLQQLAAKGKLNESEPNPAFTQCTLKEIPVVFGHLSQKGHDGSFAIFTFQPSATSNPDDAVSLQFSIAGGQIGLDWCLNSPANIRDQDKLEGYIAARGQRVRLMESNQVKYLRIEQGDLPLLCQGVIIELYAMRFDVKLDLAVQGFPWPPEAAHPTSASGRVEHSQEPATAQLT
jgi:hypothetical protein